MMPGIRRIGSGRPSRRQRRTRQGRRSALRRAWSFAPEQYLAVRPSGWPPADNGSWRAVLPAT